MLQIAKFFQQFQISAMQCDVVVSQEAMQHKNKSITKDTREWETQNKQKYSYRMNKKQTATYAFSKSNFFLQFYQPKSQSCYVTPKYKETTKNYSK